MRYVTSFVMRSGETQMDFDLDLATKKSNENPVYYAQYAHARTCLNSYVRQRKRDLILRLKNNTNISTHEKEYEVIKLMGELPYCYC